MRRILSLKPTPSMAVALMALVFALGGTSYAAVSNLAKNSVASKHIKAKAVRTSDIAGNAVTSSRVKNRSLRKADFRPADYAALKGEKGDKGDPGSPGPKGDTGATGAAGTAVAYARVLAPGTLDAAKSKGVAAGNVASGGAGVYCFSGLAFTPSNAVATAQFFDVQVHAFIGAYGGCPAATQVSVVSRNNAGTATGTPFMILFN